MVGILNLVLSQIFIMGGRGETRGEAGRMLIKELKPLIDRYDFLMRTDPEGSEMKQLIKNIVEKAPMRFAIDRNGHLLLR